MKEHILKYKELKHNIGYFTLCKIFGLPLDKLFEILDISKYKIDNNYIRFFDNNDNLIYYETSYGYWFKYEYDVNGKKTYYEDSYGYWVKYNF